MDLDTKDRDIIECLARDARCALADVGKAVGLSPSATNERVHRLSAHGVIRRFTVDADPLAFGLPVLAMVFVGLRSGAEHPAFRAFALAHAAIVECHQVTGPWCYLLHVRAADLAGVETFLSALRQTGLTERCESMVALSNVKTAPFAPNGAV